MNLEMKGVELDVVRILIFVLGNENLQVDILLYCPRRHLMPRPTFKGLYILFKIIIYNFSLDKSRRKHEETAFSPNFPQHLYQRARSCMFCYFARKLGPLGTQILTNIAGKYIILVSMNPEKKSAEHAVARFLIAMLRSEKFHIFLKSIPRRLPLGT